MNEASASKLLAEEFHATAELSAIIRGERDRYGVAEIVARIKRGDEQKRIASTVTVGTYSPAASADLLDMANPPIVPETEALSPHASQIHRPPSPGREGSVRQYRIEDGVVAEVDRGRPADDLPSPNPEPTDEELAADMARIADMKKRNGWASLYPVGDDQDGLAARDRWIEARLDDLADVFTPIDAEERLKPK